jgi:hypothetical protein
MFTALYFSFLEKATNTQYNIWVQFCIERLSHQGWNNADGTNVPKGQQHT